MNPYSVRWLVVLCRIRLFRVLDKALCRISPRFREWRAKYEWHPDDPMGLDWIIIWNLCQSNNKTLRRIGQKMWGY